MDEMFVRHRDDFIAAINSIIDMLNNEKDLMELKQNNSTMVVNEPKYKEINDNIFSLNEVLKTLKSKKTLTPEEQNIAVGALATTVIHLEYLSKMYAEAAKKGKIIIANIQAN